MKPWFVDAILTTRVIDGDTVECLLDRGHHDKKDVDLRLAGLNTPENKNTKTGGAKEREAGVLVAKVVERWIAQRAGLVLYHTSDEKPKYAGRTIGRMIANWPKHDDTDDCLNTYLLAARLAKPYDGGERPPWEPAELDAIIARAKAILE